MQQEEEEEGSSLSSSRSGCSSPPSCRCPSASGRSESSWTTCSPSPPSLRCTSRPFSPLPLFLNAELTWLSVWSQLVFLRFNAAMMAAAPLLNSTPLLSSLSSLRALHLDTEYHSYDAALDPHTNAALWNIGSCLTSFLSRLPAASSLLQLTVDAQQLTKGMPRSMKHQLGRLSGGLSAVTLPAGVDFLSLDCPDLIDDATLQRMFRPEEEGGGEDGDGPPAWGAWRRSVRVLGLVLHVEQALALLCCWRVSGVFPQLEKAHVRLMDHRLVKGGREGDDAEAAAADALDAEQSRRREEELRQLNAAVRSLVGERLWLSEPQLVAHRIDEEWKRRHGIAD